MSDSGFREIENISRDLRRLKSTFDGMREAWSQGGTSEGVDSSGTLTLLLNGDGKVAEVRLASDWRSRIGVRHLARAVNEARGAASARSLDTFASGWDPDVEPLPDEVHYRRRATSDEYRRRAPAPTSLADLQVRQEAHAAACRDYERFIEDAERLTGRETFLSPRRVFRVVRSAGSLSGLELSDEQVLLSDQELGREIVAVLEQIDQRAVVDETQEQAKYPGMSALRRSNQTLASLWEGRD